MKSLIRKAVFLLCIIIFTSSCATVPPLQTPSGRPEVTISGVTRKEVIDAIVNASLSVPGIQVKSVSEYAVVIGKKTDNMLAVALLGSRYDPTPEERATFNIVEVGSSVRVVGSCGFVTNPGSGFERVTDTSTGKMGHEMQAVLERMRNQLAK